MSFDDRNEESNSILAYVIKPATLLKLTLLHRCFSRFLNCPNGTKSRNAPHYYLLIFC